MKLIESVVTTTLLVLFVSLGSASGANCTFEEICLFNDQQQKLCLRTHWRPYAGNASCNNTRPPLPPSGMTACNKTECYKACDKVLQYCQPGETRKNVTISRRTPAPGAPPMDKTLHTYCPQEGTHDCENGDAIFIRTTTAKPSTLSTISSKAPSTSESKTSGTSGSTTSPPPPPTTTTTSTTPATTTSTTPTTSTQTPTMAISSATSPESSTSTAVVSSTSKTMDASGVTSASTMTKTETPESSQTTIGGIAVTSSTPKVTTRSTSAAEGTSTSDPDAPAKVPETHPPTDDSDEWPPWGIALVVVLIAAILALIIGTAVMMVVMRNRREKALKDDEAASLAGKPIAGLKPKESPMPVKSPGAPVMLAPAPTPIPAPVVKAAAPSPAVKAKALSPAIKAKAPFPAGGQIGGQQPVPSSMEAVEAMTFPIEDAASRRPAVERGVHASLREEPGAVKRSVPKPSAKPEVSARAKSSAVSTTTAMGKGK